MQSELNVLNYIVGSLEWFSISSKWYGDIWEDARV